MGPQTYWISNVQPGRYRQVLFPQESWIEQLRLVARSEVAQDRHDRMSGTKVPRDLHRRHDIDAARPAQAQPLVLQQVEHKRQRLLVRHLERVVDRSAFQILRDSPLADAFRDGVAFGL